MSDVPEGYKMSEVGVIPEEWEVKKLGKIADVKTGPFGSSLHERDYVNDGIPIITVEHLSEYGVVHQNLPMVSDFDRKRLSAYTLQPDDIVFSRVGSVDRNSLIKETENGWLFSGRLLRIRINTKYIFPAYLSYYFHQEPTKQRIRSVAVGQTMASLNTEILKNIEVAIPPTIEQQQAIASALTDIDALITSLEQLITKKRNIKQGAMQQLLIGKKHLPGFEGEWEVKKLGDKDISEIDSDNLNSNTNPNYSFKYISLEDVEQGFLKSYIECTFSSAPSRARRKVQKNDILFGTVRPNLKSHLFIKNDAADLICSTGFSVIRTNIDTVNAEFIYHHLFANVIERQINTLLSGSNYPAINGHDVKSLQIPFPPLPEQQAIAQILSDMDTEIETLEQKQDKYKAIKQGMMQELLTGKTRLV